VARKFWHGDHSQNGEYRPEPLGEEGEKEFREKGRGTSQERKKTNVSGREKKGVQPTDATNQKIKKKKLFPSPSGRGTSIPHNPAERKSLKKKKHHLVGGKVFRGRSGHKSSLGKGGGGNGREKRVRISPNHLTRKKKNLRREKKGRGKCGGRGGGKIVGKKRVTQYETKRPGRG